MGSPPPPPPNHPPPTLKVALDHRPSRPRSPPREAARGLRDRRAPSGRGELESEGDGEGGGKEWKKLRTKNLQRKQHCSASDIRSNSDVSTSSAVGSVGTMSSASQVAIIMSPIHRRRNPHQSHHRSGVGVDVDVVICLGMGLRHKRVHRRQRHRECAQKHPHHRHHRGSQQQHQYQTVVDLPGGAARRRAPRNLQRE